jgi:hypothetical protein
MSWQGNNKKIIMKRWKIPFHSNFKSFVSKNILVVSLYFLIVYYFLYSVKYQIIS